MNRLRLHVIACRVFERELEVLAPNAKAELYLHYVEIGLHQKPGEYLRAALQEAINTVPEDDFDAVAVVYGLCNRGIIGLHARTLPVTIPRAYDCLSLLLGSSERYLNEFHKIETYFQSSGWIEHLPPDGLLRPLANRMGADFSKEQQELVARYGEENARFLNEEFRKLTRNYQRLGLISTPVAGMESREQRAREIARQRGWNFERIPGDLSWLRRLLDGEWNEREFLLLKPHERVALRYDEQLIRAEKV